MEQQIANLPLPALLALGATLGAILGVRWWGLSQSGKIPNQPAPAAQVAAVVVDPTALNRATAALEAHTAAINKGIDTLKDTNRHIENLGIETDRAREELRIHRELGVSRPGTFR